MAKHSYHGRKKPENAAGQARRGNPQKQNQRGARAATTRRRNANTTPQAQVTGNIHLTARTVGYVRVDGLPEDVEIQPNAINTALNGDTVRIQLLPQRKGERQRGEVMEVVERAKVIFTGVLEHENGIYYLKPDDRKLYAQILVTDAAERDIAPHAKVAVELVRWTSPKKSPEGKIIEVLGPAGENETELKAIVIGKGFDWSQPENVRREAEELHRTKADFMAREIPKRRDMRGVPTFTIDPEDAKDFDDALSVRELPNGNIEIGVHIADVSAYVQKEDAIDKEAQKRGTSIYLVDRTIPMLPETLSNDLCSLNPDEEKLTFSAIFEMQPDGVIKSRWFGGTVIRSVKRFSYKEAQDILDHGEGVLFHELSIANDLARLLRAERMKNGSIAFESDEVKFVLNEQGIPVDAYRKERLETNLLIEDMMLLANRSVAEYIHERCERDKVPYPFVYRIHDAPNPDKIIELSIFLKALGFELKNKKGFVTATDINHLFDQIQHKPEQDMIETATIRSMAKAIYSTKNVGHFGLAFKYYTHFTSPIRRYPDLMVHRILRSHLEGHPVSSRESAYYARLAAQSSEREIAAVEAERDSVKYKQVEYMQSHVGETFDGIVTGIAEWGIFVEELKTKAEGLIRIHSLPDDYYELGDRGYRLIGKKTKRQFSLGDKVRILLVGADLESRMIDWKLV